jgi:3-oxoacyl-[acyl-carrier-protein] synthase-3
MTYSRIAGTGRYLPEKILTNFDLEKMVDTTDEWIRTRTGVERRHCVAPDETTSDMCVKAAKVAMDDAGVKPEDIEMVVIGTTTPDLVFPNAATLVQHRLGIPACPCIATEEACTSFIYGLSIADKFIKAGEVKRVLVIGVECITKLVDWTVQGTALLPGWSVEGTAQGRHRRGVDHHGRQRGVQGCGQDARQRCCGSARESGGVTE